MGNQPSGSKPRAPNGWVKMKQLRLPQVLVYLSSCRFGFILDSWTPIFEHPNSQSEGKPTQDNRTLVRFLGPRRFSSEGLASLGALGCPALACEAGWRGGAFGEPPLSCRSRKPKVHHPPIPRNLIILHLGLWVPLFCGKGKPKGTRHYC